ncbi:MAG: bifunctional phosphoribosylaminoimidazolecarboxamide formyltransferase/IMP cyclohydrolase [Methanoregulaceae archaeon]|nr:bifunctional phosphoribosylaminoimidazolecarboxamide formyltransferase/IMP cyclohydrolase [Methanoregulaceae archaeon]
MKWALISVWDKQGIVDLGRALSAHGVSIISSGGTGKALAAGGIAFTEVSAYTGFPEMMDGRVKTLHPKVHGGLLGRRGIDDAVMQSAGIHPIDLLVSNLYPFREKAAEGLPLEELVEFIDIGGPALIRAAAKNFHDVAVVVDPADYPKVGEALDRGGFTEDERFALARKAFAMTAGYDAAISNTLHGIGTEFPEVATFQFDNGRRLRYGENPHQQGAVYGRSGIAGSRPIQGKEMSYNNYLDLHAATGLVREFSEPCAVVVKHNNPCGVAVGEDLLRAYISARNSDPISAYGSVVAFNQIVGEDLAREICSTYVEVVSAPAFTPEAIVAMKQKENMRVLALPAAVYGEELRTIDGGVLVQRTPRYTEHWKVITDRDATPDELRSLQIGWKVCKWARSNAIVFSDATHAIGIGTGQTSRIDAAEIAIEKALESLAGTSVASDGFLPFPDTLEAAAAAGATALVQPGGSIRDNEVIAAANRLNMAMVFTGIRHFRH